MNTIFNKISIYGFLGFCLILLSFSLSIDKADAQFFYSNSGQNNASDYAYYRQICPSDFVLTVYGNGQYMCYKLLGAGVGQVLGAYSTNYNYNPVSYTSSIPGCRPGYIYSETTGQRCDSYNYNYNNNNLNGNSGSIENFDIRYGDDTSLEEGDDNSEVMEVNFDVRDGDIRLDRVEFNFEFTGNNNGEDLPWNTFEEIRLLLDGNELDSINADNGSDWDREGGDLYSITFSGLNETIRENDRANLTLEVDLKPNIDVTSNNYISWKIFVPDHGVRAFNGNGKTLYGGDDSEYVEIHIDEN